MTDKLKFKIGDYIFYHGTGICMVDDIRVLDSPKSQMPRTYYQLAPSFEGGNIFSPAERVHEIARGIISTQNARQLLTYFCQMEELTITNEKESEQEYRAILRSMDCYKMAQLYKTLYLRKKLRNEEKKTFRQLDEKYLRLTQKFISGEIAVSLKTNPDEISESMEMQLNS